MFEKFITKDEDYHPEVKFNEKETFARKNICDLVARAIIDIKNVNGDVYQNFKTSMSKYIPGKWSIIPKKFKPKDVNIAHVQNVYPETFCSFGFDGREYVVFKKRKKGRGDGQESNDQKLLVLIEKIFQELSQEISNISEVVFNEEETFASQSIRKEITNKVVLRVTDFQIGNLT